MGGHRKYWIQFCVIKTGVDWADGGNGGGGATAASAADGLTSLRSLGPAD